MKNCVLLKIEHSNSNRYWHRIANSFTFRRVNISNAKTIYFRRTNIEQWALSTAMSTYKPNDDDDEPCGCGKCGYFVLFNKTKINFNEKYVCTWYVVCTVCPVLQTESTVCIWNTKCECVYFSNVRITWYTDRYTTPHMHTERTVTPFGSQYHFYPFRCF